MTKLAEIAAMAALVLLATLPVPAGAQSIEKKTLDECLAITLERHPDLKAADSSADAGRARSFQTLSAALPQVSASYDANRRHSSATARTGAPVDGQSGSFSRTRTFNFYSTGVGLSQILFDFGQTLDAFRSAQATERSLRADATTTRETVLRNAKQAYFDLLKAGRLLAVAEENVRQNRAHLDLAEGRFDVGVAPRFDVTQAQVQLANADLALVTARNNVSVARETLGTALGLDGPLDFDIVDTLDVHDVAIDEPQALGLAYEHRPEVASQLLQEEAASRRVAFLEKNFLPNVTGNANYGYSGADYPLQENWNFGASVHWPLFNGGLTTAQVGEARANLATLKFEERSLRQRIALEVRQATLNLGRASEAIRVSDKGLQQARENLELAEGRYKTGVGNIIELTDAQVSLVTAQANNVQALSDYQTTIAALEKATGRTFERPDGAPSH
ncbi:MAG: TolC family protein [Candidatus Binatia bacterium]